MTPNNNEALTAAPGTGDVMLYEQDDGTPALKVLLTGETVWLSQQQLAGLFHTSRTNVTEHIKHIYDEGELVEAATCRDFRQVRAEGTRSVERSIPHYNLDMIISVGFRVKSGVATRFRIWATDRLRDYVVRGAAINADRLEQLGSIVSILARSVDQLIAGVADVLAGYLPGLTLLRDYDAGQLDAPRHC
ncbi:MAG: virulence RhuM family protein [Salinibacterium sp.]|nr:virulence RhuM family protein [Salinibacterium sp.]